MKMAVRNIFNTFLKGHIEPAKLAKLPFVSQRCIYKCENFSGKQSQQVACMTSLNHATLQTFSTSTINYFADNVKSVKETSKEKVEEVVDESKLTLFQRFKKMYKEYWYVLIPVHGVTSAVWFGSFFYAAKSGIDIVPLLEWMNVPEKFVAPVRGSAAGHVAVAYAMYKVATPLRYTVTLGGTTVSINYLKKLGYIKPVPTAQRFREIYDEKRIALRKKREEIQARIRAQRLRLRRRMKRRPKMKPGSDGANGKTTKVGNGIPK